MKYLFVMIVFSLLLINNINAENDITIEHIKITTIKLNNSFNFNFQTINTSTGTPLDNSLISCKFSLYNQNGNQIYLNNTPQFYNSFNWQVTVPESNFSTLGKRSVLFQCNSSTTGGLIAYPLLITPNGNEPIGDNFLIFFYILFMLVVCFLIYFLVVNLAKLATSTTSVIDVAFSWSLFFIVLITYWLATLYIPEITFTNFITNILLGTALAFLYVVMPLISLIITMIYKSFEKGNNLSVEEMLGRKIIHG